MTASIMELIKNHDDLTRKIEAANVELKDQLKIEFINVAAHELRAPIQPEAKGIVHTWCVLAPKI